MRRIPGTKPRVARAWGRARTPRDMISATITITKLAERLGYMMGSDIQIPACLDTVIVSNSSVETENGTSTYHHSQVLY